jgi:hypothetical protein
LLQLNSLDDFEITAIESQLFDGHEMQIETPLRTKREGRNMADSVWFFEICVSSLSLQ